MINRSYYPADLSIALRQRWREAGYDPAALPENDALEALIDTAYQASLLREEDDPVQCRVFVGSPNDPELQSVDNIDGPYIIHFTREMSFPRIKFARWRPQSAIIDRWWALKSIKTQVEARRFGA